MRKTFLTLAILVILALAGCGQQSNSTGGSTSPFIGGTTGLVIDFQEDSPPPEVTDDGSYPFNTIIRLENRGEYELDPSQVKVSVEGFLPSDFGVDNSDLMDKQPDEVLEPMRRDPNGNIIDGTIVFMTIPDADRPLVAKRFTGNVEFPFRATACYKYGTTANARICVLKDLLNKQDDPLCDPNAGKSLMSSGSPVQITGFRQSVIGRDKISFTFDVVHSGNGNIFKAGEGESDAFCPRDIREIRENEERVYVEVSAEGLSGLSCSLEGGATTAGYVRLINGKRTVTCTLDLTGQHDSDYEKVIDITAEFNYRDSKDKTVLVKHLIE